MNETITAVYENGILRPTSPLSLKEGETVQVTVSKPTSRPSDEELIAMMKAAKSPEELFAIANAYPTAPPGYDLCESLEDNRHREGALPLFPPEMNGKTW